MPNSRTALFLPSLLAIAVLAASAVIAGPGRAGGEPFPDGCTCISVGKKASADGSVMTSHTCDGHDGRTWIDVVPHRKHPKGATRPVYLKTDLMHGPDGTAGAEQRGSIPQVPETNGYLLGIYGMMNEHQLAIGESTFGGKEELKSEKGLIDCYELTRLLLERCRTAREAIRTAGELLAAYGYNDGGEALTIADRNEVWLLEIVGPGKDREGAIWAAQRIPDDHISVIANSSRIRAIDLSDPDRFMASGNVFSAAEELGLWSAESGEPFEFCYVYADRLSMTSRRREWRVYSLLAPSRSFDPNGENFPFSIKPEKPVAAAGIMAILRDTYEGTEFDMTKYMLVEDEDGRMVKSPYANPFMDYDQMPLWKINGGWNRKGERTLARSYCIYVHVTQSRDWLPDEIGGLLWFGYDNPAMTAYAPLFAGITRVPDSYRRGGPKDGRPSFSRESAWWAFNRVAGLAAQRWGEMRHDVAAVRDPLQNGILAVVPGIEKKAAEMWRTDRDRALEYLTVYTNDTCNRLVEAYWKLGDDLWTKYDGKF